MNENKLKGIISWVFLISHFGTFISIIAFTMAGGLDNEDAKTVAGLILPMFTVYTTTIVKAAINDRNKMVSSKVRVNPQFVAISLMLVILFAIGIPTLIIARVASFIKTQDLVLFLGLVETAFAVYIGMIIDELYGKKQDASQKK